METVDVDRARRIVKEFDSHAGNFNVPPEELEKAVVFLSKPSSQALRLFLYAGAKESDVVKYMANVVYDGCLHGHSCYRNDGFCIAHLFDLDASKKENSGFELIKNSMAGYFEPVTHGGFHLVELLSDMEAMEPLRVSTEKYYSLSENRIKRIAEKLGLSERLEVCARHVIGWALWKFENYNDFIKQYEHFCADSVPSVDYLEGLVSSYIGTNEFKELFVNAREQIRKKHIMIKEEPVL